MPYTLDWQSTDLSSGEKILQVTVNEMAGSGGSVKRNAQLDRNIQSDTKRVP